MALLAVVATVVAAGAPAPAQAAPEPGLWIGRKGDVQLSFTVRADGARRQVADVVTFCGPDASAAVPDPFVADRFAVRRDGRVAAWPRGRARLGDSSARVDAHTTLSGRVECKLRDFDDIRVRRTAPRPLQDGRYHGSERPAYDFRFDVIGGGVLFRPVQGSRASRIPRRRWGRAGSVAGRGEMHGSPRTAAGTPRTARGA